MDPTRSVLATMSDQGPHHSDDPAQRAPDTSDFDREQASMYYVHGSEDGFQDASTIVDFSWNQIERRLNELADPSILQHNERGEQQEIPKKIAYFPEKSDPEPDRKPRKAGTKGKVSKRKVDDDDSEHVGQQEELGSEEKPRPEESGSEEKPTRKKRSEQAEQSQQAGYVRGPALELTRAAVLAISLNNYAYEHNLPCKQTRLRWTLLTRIDQFRYYITFLKQNPIPSNANIYVTKRAWTEEQRQCWGTSTAFRRQHSCSINGAWDWTDAMVLRIPLIWQRSTAEVDRRMDGGYNVRIPKTDRRLGTLDTAFHLVLQRLENWYVLLLTRPGDLRIKNKHVVGSVPASHRCREAKDVVELCSAAVDKKEALEPWGPIFLAPQGSAKKS